MSGPRQRQKATQPQRLRAAAVEIMARDGYNQTTVAKIVAAAGVSRPTFYEYFADKDGCVLEAVLAINRRLLSQVANAIEQSDPSRAALLATETIVDFCDAQPDAARVWLIECLAGAGAIRDARDEAIDALAWSIDHAHEAASRASLIPDIGSDALLGGIHRLLGSRVRAAESIAGARAPLLAWIESYEVSSPGRSWQRLSSLHLDPAAPGVDPPFGAPPRPRSAADYAGRDPAEYQRDRVFYAAAQLLLETGVERVTIAEIAQRAGVGYRRLTGLFPDKEALVAGLQQLGHLRTLAATSGGYFSSHDWPDQVWAAGCACSRYVGANATLANVAFVTPYCSGPRAARNADGNLKAFTLFLHEGYAQMPAGRPRPSAPALEAIAATIFELGYRMCRAGNAAELPSLLPRAVFVALAPFLGAEEAGEFVGGKVEEMEAGG